MVYIQLDNWPSKRQSISFMCNGRNFVLSFDELLWIDGYGINLSFYLKIVEEEYQRSDMINVLTSLQMSDRFLFRIVANDGSIRNELYDILKKQKHELHSIR